MKKKLKVTVEKILTSTEKKYKILKIEGYTLDQLPKYYVDVPFNEYKKSPFVYISDEYKDNKLIRALCIESETQVSHLGIYKYNNCILYEGDIVSETYFNKIYNYLKSCSHRLKEINDILKITDWEGEENFIF